MYIILEGIDTCGKSTQIELLKNRLQNCVTTKEPFDANIRSMILEGNIKSKEAEMFLFLADRSEHFENIVKPNIKDKIVISDRGFISGVAYAITNGNDNINELINLNKIALQNSLPNLVILFDINKSTLLSRINTKTKDNIEQRGIQYLLDVQTNMQKITKELNLNHIIIDAKDSIENINQKIINKIEEIK
jgi:dTMP kinase